METACRRPKVNFSYLRFDWSEVMFVSCTHITSDQSKHSCENHMLLHIYPMKSLVLHKKQVFSCTCLSCLFFVGLFFCFMLNDESWEHEVNVELNWIEINYIELNLTSLYLFILFQRRPRTITYSTVHGMNALQPCVNATELGQSASPQITTTSPLKTGLRIGAKKCSTRWPSWLSIKNNETDS